MTDEPTPNAEPIPNAEPPLPLREMIQLRFQCLQVITQSTAGSGIPLKNVLAGAEFMVAWLCSQAKAADYDAWMPPSFSAPEHPAG